MGKDGTSGISESYTQGIPSSLKPIRSLKEERTDEVAETVLSAPLLPPQGSKATIKRLETPSVLVLLTWDVAALKKYRASHHSDTASRRSLSSQFTEGEHGPTPVSCDVVTHLITVKEAFKTPEELVKKIQSAKVLSSLYPTDEYKEFRGAVNTEISKTINSVISALPQTKEEVEKKTPKERQTALEHIAILAQIVDAKTAAKLRTILGYFSKKDLIFIQEKQAYEQADIRLSQKEHAGAFGATEELMQARHSLMHEIGKLGRFLHTVGLGFRLFTPSKTIRAGEVILGRLERAVNAVRSLEGDKNYLENLRLMNHEVAELDKNPLVQRLLSSNAEFKKKYLEVKAGVTLSTMLTNLRAEFARRKADPSHQDKRWIFRSLHKEKGEALSKEEIDAWFQQAEERMLDYILKNFGRVLALAEKSPEGMVSISKHKANLPYTLRCISDKTTGLASFHLSFGLFAVGGEAIIKEFMVLETGERGVKRSLKQAEDAPLTREMAEKDELVRRLVREKVPGLVVPAPLVVRGVTSEALELKPESKQASSAVLYPGGDVHHFIASLSPKTRGKWTPEKQRIAIGVIRTVIAMHKKGVIHFDIKPRNVLLTDDKSPRLGDFGLADERGVMINARGTRGYMAPELFTALIEKRQFAAAPCHDLWSLGPFLFELLYQENPFIGSQCAIISPRQAGYNTRKEAGGHFLGDLQEFRDFLSSPKRKYQPLVSIINGLLDPDPAKRMTDDQLEAAVGDLESMPF